VPNVQSLDSSQCCLLHGREGDYLSTNKKKINCAFKKGGGGGGERCPQQKPHSFEEKGKNPFVDEDKGGKWLYAKPSAKRKRRSIHQREKKSSHSQKHKILLRRERGHYLGRQWNAEGEKEKNSSC